MNCGKFEDCQSSASDVTGSEYECKHLETVFLGAGEFMCQVTPDTQDPSLPKISVTNRLEVLKVDLLRHII